VRLATTSIQKKSLVQLQKITKNIFTIDLTSPEGTRSINSLAMRPVVSLDSIGHNFYNFSSSKITMKLLLQKYGQYLYTSNGSGKLGENDAEETKNRI
jgi:hypothetical protein